MVATDDEMVARVLAASPAVVSIDSPLSLPFGRTRVEDDDPSRAEFGIMRRCERELKRRGINVYPCLLPSMQRLTRRGMQLAERLRKLGFPVIESYPGAAQDIIGIPRKGAGAEFLKQGLAEFGICGKFTKESVRHDELDAITSALVGAFFLAGKYEALSGPSEGALIIPDLKAPSGPVVVGISGRICAGKTTAAGAIEQLGFAYTRFSLVIDEEIRQRGQEPDRESRQRVGQEISETKGQRWLCERVLARVSGSRLIVVDGLRFFEDRAFLIERFGTCFLHLHISAPAKLRKKRFGNESADGLSFEDADGRSVEREIDGLGRMAHTTIKNVGAIHELEAAVQQKVSIFLHSSGQECPSPRSH
jgi:predicted nuclease with RNAse H fold/dephospho-CoA kinase